MVRKPRVEFPCAPYQVIATGNRRTTLFYADADFAAYLERLECYPRRDSLQCYAFILMANHLHLLVETGAVLVS
jgi:putative transposase